LRGPQTEGELRARAGRMEPIDDLDALRAVLRPLAERGLVVYLSPEGRRGTMLTHGFHPARELERLRTTHRAGAPEPAEQPPPSAREPAADQRLPSLEARLSEATAEIAALRALVTDLQGKVAGLADQLAGLRAELGA